MPRTRPTPAASIVIRARNEAAFIGRLLDDLGSTAETRVIAAARGSRLIDVDRAASSYGGALNTGCAATRGRAGVSVSAHLPWRQCQDRRGAGPGVCRD
jgi:hypothetical protein